MSPPNPILQTPSTRPAMNRPEKPSQRKSQDDLSQLVALDAADARARAAKALMDEEHAQRVAAEQRTQELERKLNDLINVPLTKAEVKSMRPGATGHLQLAFKDWKIVIPFGLIAAAVPIIWPVVQHVIGVERDIKNLTTIVSSYESRLSAADGRMYDLEREQAVLKNTVARQAGFIAGIFPLAGVSIPGAELGAIQVDIDHDAIPLGARHAPRVVTHTRVPAPPPDK